MAGEKLGLATSHALLLEPQHELAALQTTPQVPGAWFFEVGAEYGSDSASSGSTTSGLGGDLSPGFNDFSLEEFQLRFALNSRNVTDTVEVPSSEHVAEIVGRQGCKIKALRAKTNTYIKTPLRGEEPVFTVTGKQEDVVEAKREIECAAEHFTHIRASRRHSQGGAPAPGHITAYVRVPLKVVGLVVGPKGATIKRIQQDTHTYIITPSREREPIFEVTGLPQNVDAARREIEQHIYQRTGNMPITDPNASVTSFDFQAAAAAACRSASGHSLTANRPNYGALAAGTHERRKEAAKLEMSVAIKAMQEAQEVADYKGYMDALQTYEHAEKVMHQSMNAQAAAASQLGVVLHPQLHFAQRSLGAAFPTRESPLHQDGLNLDHLSETNAALDCLISMPLSSVASAPNSTRGSSPAIPVSVGSQASLHNNYSTWSSHNDHSYEFNSNGLAADQSMKMVASLLNTGCSLKSANSDSRDEGLGDSPTNSMGRLDRDPYHLMISSIWNDLDSQQSSSTAAEPARLATA